MGEFMNIKFDLPVCILRDRNIKPLGIIVYGILNDAATPGVCYTWTDISNAAILALFDGNISRRTLNNILGALERHGYIKRTIVVRHGQQNTRVIEILRGAL